MDGLLQLAEQGDIVGQQLPHFNKLAQLHFVHMVMGKGSAAGERTKLILGLVFVSCGRTGFAGGGLVVVVV